MPSLAGLDLAAVERAVRAEQMRRQTENRLAYYKPYPKQMDFHAAGLTKRERLLRAGNQNGKTWAGGFEAAMHVTGEYPDWWRGRRFDKPVTMWAAGVTGETTRDNPQRVLMGNVGERGSGTIPKAAIAETANAHGVSDLLDYAKVRHKSGGVSTVRFKYYEQGRRKWQGPPVDVVWFDEEPPAEIYDEGLARTIATAGLAYMTFTPLLGMSDVVRRFLTERSNDRHDTNMTIDDAEHIPAEERARIIASFPAHEREARARGTPILGSGRIFPVTEDLIACDPISFPDHWPRIGGMDFGWTHPFAAVEVVWDRETGTVYVNRTHRMSEATPIVHAAAIRPWGNLKWSWPRDGRRDTLEGAGVALANQFGDQGLDMLHEHAQFEDGSVSVEAGLFMMLTLMETGKFKVMRHLHDWFEEFRLYHRKDGKVVKENDDLMAATRYAIMMLRYATCVKEENAVSWKRLLAPRSGSQGGTSWMN